MQKTLTTILLLTFCGISFAQTYRIKQMKVYDWSSSSSAWKDRSKTEFSYSEDETTVTAETGIYNSSSAQWDKGFKTETISGSNGLQSRERMKWNSGSGAYEKDSLHTIGYGSLYVNGSNYFFIADEYYMKWNASKSAWDTVYHEDSKPNLKGVQSSTIGYKNSSGNMVSSQKMQYFYDGELNRTQTWFYSWVNTDWSADSAINDIPRFDVPTYQIYQRKVNLYDTAFKVFTKPYKLISYEYDDSNLLVLKTTSLWSVADQKYQDIEKMEVTYNSEFRLHEEIFYTSEDGGKTWNKDYKNEYEFEMNSVSVANIPLSISTIFPNPASDAVTINNPYTGLIKLLDFQGRVIRTFKKENSGWVMFDCSEIPAGNYLIQFTGTRGELDSKRLVICH